MTYWEEDLGGCILIVEVCLDAVQTDGSAAAPVLRSCDHIPTAERIKILSVSAQKQSPEEFVRMVP